jgi:acyl carrier protein
MKTDLLEDRIRNCFCECLNRRELSADLSFFDAGGDSLHMINLLLLIEDEFESEIPLQYFVQHATIRGVCAYFKSIG